MNLIWKELLVWYGSFLVFPFLVFIVLKRKKLPKILFFIIILGCLFFIWARYIEPQIIITRTHTIETGFKSKIILISDTHLGIYKKASFMKRVVDKINKEKPDYVFIAGDLTYEAKEEEIKDLFKPFGDFEAPTYVVLGNHDIGQPGPPIREELLEVLQNENVNIIDNQIISLPNLTLVGLGDRWGQEDNVKLLDTFSEKDNVVVLTHDPDTTLDYTNNNADLTLVGHTHCGQMRIPWLYKYAIPTKGPFDKGLTQEKYTQLYITCGVGETALPLRLFNPPVIDILNLQ